MDAPYSTLNPNFSAPYSTPSTPYSSTPSTPYSSTPSTPICSAPSTPNTYEPPFSPMQTMQSPVTTSPPFRAPFDSPQTPSAFGASLYNMIHTASPSNTNIFAAHAPPQTQPMRSPSMGSIPSPMIGVSQSNAPRLDPTLPSAGFTNFATPFSNAASLPYPYDATTQMYTSTLPSSFSSTLPSPSSIPSHQQPTYAPVDILSPSLHMQMQYTSIHPQSNVPLSNVPPPYTSSLSSALSSPSLSSTPTYMNISSPTYMVTSPSISSTPTFSSLSSAAPSSFPISPPSSFPLSPPVPTYPNTISPSL